MKLIDVNTLKDIEYESFAFSGGERHIKIAPGRYDVVYIYANITNSDKLMEVLLATDALKRLQVKEIYLNIPYIPYARQDRVMVEGEPLSIKVFADIINSQGYKGVYVLDPHSEVSTALINNVSLIDMDSEIDGIIKQYSDCVLVSPDAGSLKKVYKIARRNSLGVVECSKKRAVSDGEILGCKINEPNIKPKTHIIIDDICDGGRTFVECARELKVKGAKEVILIISHAIFSKGFEELKKWIDKIYYFNILRDLDAKQTVNVDYGYLNLIT